MAKRNVGLYLGVNSVAGVVVENRRIVSYAKFDLSAVEEEAKIERLSEDIRLEALINKTLRDIGATEKNVYVSLADKDFIFRFLDMPLMKKKEIEVSLMYEVVKYIPFKMEELRWGYGYTTFARDKKINLSFVGIKDSNLTKIKDILSRLGLNPVAIEPSSLSLIRVLKSLKKHAVVKNFALLDYTDSEAYLTLFYHNLPIFNRYLVIPKKDGTIDFDKFIDSVRLSFQYFKREFDFYDLEKFIIMGASGAENLVSFFKEELQTTADIILPSDVTGKPDGEVEHVKALGVSGIDYYPYQFKPILTKKEELGERPQAPAITPLNIGLLLVLVGIGLLTAFIFAIFTGNSTSTEKALLDREEAAVSIPNQLKGLAWDTIETTVKDKEDKSAALAKLEASLSRCQPTLERIAALLPQGFWLESLEFNPAAIGYNVDIRGYAFLSDANKESLALDGLIASLKKEPAIKSAYRNIDLTSSEKREIRKYQVTSFSIRME
ncbi:MAG: hypothetical protein PHQ96_02195 [Candidatus Omnitrophica bacterium]|nr:hypothetical protein [Candidatus Omnitrophota bacterium]